MNRCPSDGEVDEVLDRLAQPEQDAAVRRHVACCTHCLQRMGALFELDLWGPSIAKEASPDGRPTPARGARAPRDPGSPLAAVHRLALPAALVALIVLLASWFTIETGPAQPTGSAERIAAARSRTPPAASSGVTVHAARLTATETRGDQVAVRMITRDESSRSPAEWVERRWSRHGTVREIRQILPPSPLARR